MGFDLDVLARLAGQRPDLPHGEGAMHPPRGPGDALMLYAVCELKGPTGNGMNDDH